MPDEYIPCAYCGKLNKVKLKTRPPRFCTKTACRVKHKNWMAQHRRVIADKVTTCPTCGKFIGQYKMLGSHRLRMGCTHKCSQRAQMSGVKPVYWDAYSKLVGQGQEYIKKSSCTSGEMQSFRATVCQKLYSKQRPCVHYTECLDKEVESRGSGFKPDCTRFEELTMDTDKLKLVGSGGLRVNQPGLPSIK